MMFVMAGAQSCEDAGPGPARIPTGVSWELECVEPLSTDLCTDPDSTYAYTIRFYDDGTVTGSNACNTCTGTYVCTAANRLDVMWGCTEMACGDPPPWLDYDRVVGMTNSFSLAGERLVLTYVAPTGEVLRLFHKRVEAGALTEYPRR
jgi:hypothetical protein